ncbi:cysteine desulfurase family protein [Lactobacillus sp. LL6]|uniref:cysteine desulfurase family protein n=1 Tax=Lactobacillus sp. LL6 TaxID=2596827 RepID=UPI0016426C41|nr:cysteine desulfurase family protein [Lactobacillus sp. LL6]
MNRIYLDNSGTTPMAPEVVKTMTEMMTNVFGNASATNYYGREAKNILETSRHTIAKTINANDKEIIFTSGGTESDNTAIMQTAMLRKNEGKHIISTKFEHEAVLRPLQRLEDEGFEVTYLNIDENGQIDLDELKNAIRPDTILVTIMMINNEVGSLLPIKKIGEIVKPTNAWFHTDAVQAYGSVPIDVKEMNIDLLSTSAHKLNGPKLLGFLYERDGIDLPSFIQGGDQELKRRAGTENVPAIAGFATAAKLHYGDNHLEENTKKYASFKHALVDGLTKNEIEFEVNGQLDSQMAPQVINIWFKGIKADVLLTNLDLDGIVGAAGSACTAGSLDPSHVLISMYGKDSPRVWESLRFSFGIENTLDDINQLVETLTKITTRLKNRNK